MYQVRKPSTKYVDCNESSWQVALWIHGEQFFFSARTAAPYLFQPNGKPETPQQQFDRKAP